MATKEMIEKVATKLLGKRDMFVHRSGGGCRGLSPTIRGFQLTVFLEDDKDQWIEHTFIAEIGRAHV